MTAPPVDIGAYEAAAKSTPVLKGALEDLGSRSASRASIDGLRKRLSVTAEQTKNSSLIHVQVRDPNPSQAAAQANAVAASLLGWDKNRAAGHLQTIVDTLQAQIKALDAEIVSDKTNHNASTSDISGLQQLKAQQTLELNAARALKSSAVGALEIVNPAQPPLQPVEPRPKLAAAIAAVLAIIVSYLIVFLRSALDSRYHSVDELSRDLDLNVLGEFPSLRSGVGLLPRDRVNYLRTNLSFASAAAHPKIFLVTSADSGNGKTTLAINLAEAYARNDYKTLLLDGDLRKPDVATQLGVEAEGAWDLASLLENPSLEPTLRQVDIDGVSFHVLPASVHPSQATELLSRGFKTVLERLKDFDVVVIDSAPILPVADSLVIAPHTSGALVAASVVDTDKRRIRNAMGLLQRLGVNVFGVAATRVSERKTRRRGSGYGYGYGYGYGQNDEAGLHPKQRGRSGAIATRFGRRSRTLEQEPSRSDHV